MATLEEQNKNKIAELDVDAIKNMLWAKYKEPDFIGLLNKFVVYPPLYFKASKEAIEYIKDTLGSMEAKIKELKAIKNKTEDQKTEYKALKKDFDFKMTSTISQIINVSDISPAFMDKYSDYIIWPLLAMTFDFNLKPDFINRYKKSINYTMLQKNPSWNTDSDNEELNNIKAYWKLIINNHPDANLQAFGALTLQDIEEGVRVPNN